MKLNNRYAFLTLLNFLHIYINKFLSNKPVRSRKYDVNKIAPNLKPS